MSPELILLLLSFLSNPIKPILSVGHLRLSRGHGMLWVTSMRAWGSFQVWQCRLRTVIQDYMPFNVNVVYHSIQAVSKVASSNQYYGAQCQWV